MGAIMKEIGKGSVTVKGFSNVYEDNPKIVGEQTVKIRLFVTFSPRSYPG